MIQYACVCVCVCVCVCNNFTFVPCYIMFLHFLKLVSSMLYLLEPMHAGETQVTFYMKQTIVPTELRAEITAAYVSVQGNMDDFLSPKQ